MGSRSWQKLAVLLTVVGSAFGAFSIPAVQAIPSEKITEILQPVTFFMLDSEGKGPLLAPAENGSGVGTAGFFVNVKDADAFLKQLAVQNPDLAKTVRIRPVSLATIYRVSQASKKNSEAMKVTIIPSQEQVDSAVSLLLLHGQKIRTFSGTPVFLARLFPENSYLTVERNKESVIPVFFTKEELQEMLKKYRKERPEQANSIDIQVLSLEEMLSNLPLATNQTFESIVLVPPKESIEYLKKVAESLPPTVTPEPPAPSASAPTATAETPVPITPAAPPAVTPEPPATKPTVQVAPKPNDSQESLPLIR